MCACVQGRSQGWAKEGPAPTQCWLCPANKNSKSSIKYCIKAVRGFLCPANFKTLATPLYVAYVHTYVYTYACMHMY